MKFLLIGEVKYKRCPVMEESYSTKEPIVQKFEADNPDTARQEAKNKLREYEETYKTIIKTAHGIVFPERIFEGITAQLLVIKPVWRVEIEPKVTEKTLLTEKVENHTMEHLE